MEITEDNTPKRRKTKNAQEIGKEVVLSTDATKPERCPICRQYVTEVTFYNGHPNNAVEECVALTDEKLMLFTGEENEISDLDLRPTHKVIFTNSFVRTIVRIGILGDSF